MRCLIKGIASILSFGVMASTVPDRSAYFRESLPVIRIEIKEAQGSAAFMSQLLSSEADQLHRLSIYLDSSESQGLKVLFSSRSQDFVLSPGEPARTAKTTSDASSPIYVNLKIINDLSTRLKFVDVYRLMIHEVGHKLGPHKIQAAVDSLAAKLATRLSTHFSEGVVTFGMAVERRADLASWIEYSRRPSVLGQNPLAFLVHQGRVQKIDFAASGWSQALKPCSTCDARWFLNRLDGAWLNGGMNILLNFLVETAASKMSFSDQVTLPGFTEYVSDGSGRSLETIVLSDTNFRLMRPALDYRPSSLLNDVLETRVMSEDDKEIVIRVKALLGRVPRRVALQAGEWNNSFLISGIVSSREGDLYTLDFRFQRPRMSCLPVIEVFGLILDNDERLTLEKTLSFEQPDRVFRLSDLRVGSFQVWSRGAWRAFDELLHWDLAEVWKLRQRVQTSAGIRDVRLRWLVERRESSAPAGVSEVVEENIAAESLKLNTESREISVLSFESRAPVLVDNFARGTRFALKEALITDSAHCTRRMSVKSDFLTSGPGSFVLQ